MELATLLNMLYDSKVVIYDNNNGYLKLVYDNHYGARDRRNVTPKLSSYNHYLVYQMRCKACGMTSYLEIRICK